MNPITPFLPGTSVLLTCDDLPHVALEVARRADALRAHCPVALLSDIECWEQAEREVLRTPWQAVPRAVA